MHLPPPVIALAAILALFVANWLVPGLSIKFSGQWIVGGIFMALGIVIGLIAISGFFQAKTTWRPDEIDKASALVTEGIYRFTRNPMYLGLALVITGFVIGLGTMIGPIVLAVFVWAITNWQIIPEERALEKIFGQEFVDYKKRVRRWI